MSNSRQCTLTAPLAVSYYAGWHRYPSATLAAGTVVDVELTTGRWGIRANGRDYTARAEDVVTAVSPRKQ